MGRRASRAWRIVRVSGWVLALAATALIVYDLVAEPPRPDYRPVIRPTALDHTPTPVANGGCVGSPDRWLVVGWDGAGWDQLLPLIDAGRLPNLARLRDNGVHGNLYGFKPSLSPALWTTVATGASPERHGIVGFEPRRHRLRKRWDRIRNLGRRDRTLLTNADRRVESLWNRLDETGRRSLVVGYHNTFPAERIDGAMVSNWLVQAQMADVLRAEAARPEFLRSLAYPAELQGELDQVERAVRARWKESIRSFVSLEHERETVAWIDASARLGDEEDRWPYFVRRAWTFDSFHAEVALRLMPRVEPDLTMVHFQAADWALHQFLFFHQPELFDESPWDDTTAQRLAAARSRYGATAGRFFEFLDARLGQLIDAAGPDVAVLVLSDHGFAPHTDPWSSGEHDEAPPGFWVAAGPGVRQGLRVDGATLYDIAPTLGAAFGLPPTASHEGRVLTEAFCDLDPIPALLDVSDEQRFQPDIAPPAQLTDELRRQLESLGYTR